MSLPKLIYVPLEPYEQRYTGQLSRAWTGWFERNWIDADIDYIRIDGPADMRAEEIQVGQVVDGFARWRWSAHQISNLIVLAMQGHITDDHVIYFDDFWTPGMGHLFYVFDQLGIFPKVYSFCWAQSVDEHDFTHKMSTWLRHFERGIGSCMTGVFVANSMLKHLLSVHGVLSRDRIHVVGLPFDSREVFDTWQKEFPGNSETQQPLVVYSSRCDTEKDPLFFLEVAKRVWALESFGGFDFNQVRFAICSGAPKLTSNDPDIVRQIQRFEQDHPNFFVNTGLRKAEYYDILASAKVQFNCALQDWVSFTLLEAVTFGCSPVYPRRRSFPETFTDDAGALHEEYLYDEGVNRDHTIRNAVEQLAYALCRPDNPRLVEERRWIAERFDNTWKRQAVVMGVYPDHLDRPKPLYGLKGF